MKWQRNKSLNRIVGLACGVLVLVPAPVWGQGSIAFNGTYYASPLITAGTSKLENTGANILNGQTQLTVCFWIYKEWAKAVSATSST